MPKYNDQMLKIWEKYKEEVSSEPADLKEMGAWARSNGLWAPRPIDIDANFARDMAEALREQTRTDKAGRRYRAFIPARAKGKDGLPLFKGIIRLTTTSKCAVLGLDNDNFLIHK